MLLVGLMSPLVQPLAGEDGCMDCHSDPDLSIRRHGQTVSLHVEEKVFEHGAHAGFACVDCHVGLDPDLFPHANPMPRVACMSCHFDAADVHGFHPQMAEMRIGGEIPQAGDCSACHGKHAIEARASEQFPFTGNRQVLACGTCHQAESAEFAISAHARVLRSAGGEVAPDCLTCHNDPRMLANGDELTRKRAMVGLCNDCHLDNETVAGMTLFGTPFIVAFEDSVHGRALQDGNAEAPACTDCHGNHAVDRAVNRESLVSRQQVSATCAACHPQAQADVMGSAHGQAYLRGNRDAPVCTDCHGEHNIMASSDPNARVSERNMSQQVCGECHGSVRLAERYNLSTNTFQTFADSYHGLAGRSGSVSVVNCASCHGYHNVLNSSDPQSLVHPDNLAQTCGSCHPGANSRFAIGKVHVALDRSSDEPVLYWIATLYVWLIILVVGGMVLHNLVDYVHKVRRKALAHWGHIPHGVGRARVKMHLRMTLNERLQHAVLAVSFIVLVITGFMLRYPEAWWVEGLRNLNSNIFEWRNLTHRIAGVVMLVGGIWHVVYVIFTPRGRELLKAILPRIHDFNYALGVTLHNLGIRKEKPKGERFTYIEKVEYWAMIWGTLLMTVTGFLLWFDDFTMGLFTKLGFDIFRIVHFYEAVLATLAIIVWHFYFVIFNPDVYPMNMAWLTGKMSEEEMLHEHPLELERILEAEQAKEGETKDPA